MSRFIAALLSVGMLLAGQTAAAQPSTPPSERAGPAPSSPGRPPTLTKDPAKLIAAGPIPATKPAVTSTTAYARPPAAAKPIAAAPAPSAVGERNDDCARRAPNLIHDSRSPGGCAPCTRGWVPNSARQACVVPIPSLYRRPSGG